jgi:23S rRNA (uracil-5-)-methyltransferase RumA
MKKNQIVNFWIEKMATLQEGVGVVDQKPVHVKGALPGQKVEVRISRNRDHYVEGKLLSVLEKSEIEISSFCTHYGDCGGCSLQTVPYGAQLEMKRDWISGLLETHLPEAVFKGIEFTGVLPSPKQLAYRNKMEFTFGNAFKGGETNLGLHKKGQFGAVITTDHCQICDSDFTEILSAVLEFFKKRGVDHYNKFSHEGILRHLVIRKGEKTGEILVALSAARPSAEDLRGFVDLVTGLKLRGEVVGVLYVENTGKADAVNGEPVVLFGRDHYYDEILGLRFRISLYSFFQTNTLGAELLYQTAFDGLEDIGGKYVFDLFSGTGTIAQLLARRAKRVVGIEIVADAVEAAIANAAENKLSHCEFRVGDVLEILDHYEGHKPEVIVVDPPRMGISQKALEKIVAFGAPDILYISCNPKTLAENLSMMALAGYQPVKVTGVDMFPHTSNCETICWLRRRGGNEE